MGVQATMTIGDKKGAVAVAVASAAATIPVSPSQVRIVSILPAADLHRLADIERAVVICLDFARDNNIFDVVSGLFVVTTLDGGKNAIRTGGGTTNVITGDVGIMVNGSLRGSGYNLIVDEAHKQLLDFMRESGQLAVAA